MSLSRKAQWQSYIYKPLRGYFYNLNSNPLSWQEKTRNTL